MDQLLRGCTTGDPHHVVLVLPAGTDTPWVEVNEEVGSIPRSEFDGPIRHLRVGHFGAIDPQPPLHELDSAS